MSNVCLAVDKKITLRYEASEVGGPGWGLKETKADLFFFSFFILLLCSVSIPGGHPNTGLQKPNTANSETHSWGMKRETTQREGTCILGPREKLV
jgi:hypothetical protein